MNGPAALARHVAEWMVEHLAATAGPVAVALSGGSTPKVLYTLLATAEFAGRMPWDRVHWCWGDERFVPPDDPSSNYRMTMEAMLRHVPAPADHVHPIPTTGVSPAAAAAMYEQTLRDIHGDGDLARPLFEIVLLGLGTNGHFASLFPDTPSLTERTAWATDVTPAGEKTRITLTYPPLESCRHAAFLVAGADKREVLARVRAGQPDLPASHYRPSGELHWFADDAAEGRGMTKIGLGLQGGGSHGAFTWGVLARLLEEVEGGRLEIAAVSGASAGAINATVLACGLAEGGPGLARTRLEEAWRAISTAGALGGNALFYGEPGPFGLNIDWNPGAIALEALGLVVSPYTNPFYHDPLGPVLREVLPPERLALLDGDGAPKVFLTATNVATNRRAFFSQPEVTIDAIRASACLPGDYRAVQIGGKTYWDGGYLGNPALEPLIGYADDLFVVLANPLERKTGVPPKGARAILDRLNEITFNASVVLEMNGIAAVNAVLRDLEAKGIKYEGKYRQVHLHMIRDDDFLAGLGSVSKSSTSWVLLSQLHKAGYAAAARFFAERADDAGRGKAGEAEAEVVRPMVKGRPL